MPGVPLAPTHPCLHAFLPFLWAYLFSPGGPSGKEQEQAQFLRGEQADRHDKTGKTSCFGSSGKGDIIICVACDSWWAGPVLGLL